MKKMLKKVIVHGGNAHLDDFVTCAEIMAYQCITLPATAADVAAALCIERRDPTAAELADPDTIVADVGGELSVERSNFDHHQLPRGSRDCAMTLFARNAELPGHKGTLHDALVRLYPWYETRAVLDSNGPFKAAAEKGVEWGVVQAFMGPFEDMVLDSFINAAPEQRPQVVLPLVLDMLGKLEAEERVNEALVRYTTSQGVDVVDFTKADPADVDTVSDSITAAMANGVAVFRDKRGPGFGILRIKDDPRVDLSRTSGMPCMGFIHSNGFYATTREPVERATMADILGTAFVPQA